MTEIVAFMMSCRARERVRAQTLARLAATDWDAEPIVVLDDELEQRPQARQERTARLLLEQAAALCAGFVLFLEDDLDFNRHIRHNLGHWEPLIGADPDEHLLAWLYDPGIAGTLHDPAGAYSVAQPECIYGSQGLLLSRATVDRVLAGWHSVPGMQDIKISRLAAAEGPVLQHRPSLVQHVTGPSTWGGSAHVARDFAADWRARELTPA